MVNRPRDRQRERQIVPRYNYTERQTERQNDLCECMSVFYGPFVFSLSYQRLSFISNSFNNALQFNLQYMKGQHESKDTDACISTHSDIHVNI